jgi:hypothetical protein
LLTIALFLWMIPFSQCIHFSRFTWKIERLVLGCAGK